MSCVQCGDCCDPVRLDGETYRKTQDPRSGGASVDFIREHWTVVGHDGDQYQLSCDRFDPAARRCTAYEDRPPVCSEFPWYGRDPGTSTDIPRLNDNCSFYWDLPEDTRGSALYKLIPVAVA